MLYLLHGGNDDYTSWTRETDIEQLSANAQALIVMPEAGRDATYVDWFRPDGGPNAGLWETFHLTEEQAFARQVDGRGVRGEARLLQVRRRFDALRREVVERRKLAQRKRE